MGGDRFPVPRFGSLGFPVFAPALRVPGAVALYLAALLIAIVGAELEELDRIANMIKLVPE